ncbi:uncharacterized protein LOC119471151 [Cebus imitator]|uniref:uncharacterized protein LOC119471151 n=1 Tax=Cebus imitator TaxID=2715852 RepID=UPI0018986A18|nr:uncharacterized protein LOC119471151 [Cebus imitator]
MGWHDISHPVPNPRHQTIWGELSGAMWTSGKMLGMCTGVGDGHEADEHERWVTGLSLFFSASAIEAEDSRELVLLEGISLEGHLPLARVLGTAADISCTGAAFPLSQRRETLGGSRCLQRPCEHVLFPVVCEGRWPVVRLQKS